MEPTLPTAPVTRKRRPRQAPIKAAELANASPNAARASLTGGIPDAPVQARKRRVRPVTKAAEPVSEAPGRHLNALTEGAPTRKPARRRRSLPISAQEPVAALEAPVAMLATTRSLAQEIPAKRSSRPRRSRSRTAPVSEVVATHDAARSVEEAPATHTMAALTRLVQDERPESSVSVQNPVINAADVRVVTLDASSSGIADAPNQTEAEPPGQRSGGPRLRRERTNIFEVQKAPLDPVEALLEFFRANAKPWPARELVKRLSATDLERLGGRKGLDATLERLVKDGRLVSTRRNTFGLPEEMNLVVGRFQGHTGGFGFLVPETAGLRDHYIPPDATMAAWHNDRVVARTAPRRRAPGGGGPVGSRTDDAPRGQVIRILKRARETVVGSLEYAKGYAILRPDDTRLNHRVLLLPENLGQSPAGSRIVARLFWPEDTGEDEPYGSVVEVLGSSDSPETETEAVVRKFNLGGQFPPDVQAESVALPERIPVADLKGRTDLRERNVFTIDGRDAKDFDDAIHIEPLANGHFLVGVHIADVSHYVREGQPLDNEARERATSVYLPGRVIPMLPEKLSNGICSLIPNEDRLAVSVLVELTPDGAVVNYQVVNSVIHSRARLTYDEVQAFSEGKASLPEASRAVEGDMHLLLKLTTRMREKRFREGSLDFRLREVKVEIGVDGKLSLVPVREETARGLVEDMMLLANKIVAADLVKKKVPTLFRVHEEPTEVRFQEVTAALGKMGLAVKGSQPTPQAYQEVLASVRGTPQEAAVNNLLLRSMRQARYSSENRGHFGLAFDDYLHFTSPIRRYPDLIVHRIMKLSLSKKLSQAKRGALETTLPSLAEHTSERERNATEAERDLTKYYQARWAAEHLGEEFAGAVSGVLNTGVFVSLQNGVEGLLHISQLDDDYYVFLEDSGTLRGRATGRTLRIGSPISVRIQHVNPIARQVDFALKETEMNVKERGRHDTHGRDRKPVVTPNRDGRPADGAARRPEMNVRAAVAPRVLILSGHPRMEHPRPVRVTARRLYFGEWTRAHLEVEEGRPSERVDSRPSSANAGRHRPEPSRSVQHGTHRDRAGRGHSPDRKPTEANAARAVVGPREGAQQAQTAVRSPQPVVAVAEVRRPTGPPKTLRFAGGTQPAEPASLASARKRRRRRRHRGDGGGGEAGS